MSSTKRTVSPNHTIPEKIRKYNDGLTAFLDWCTENDFVFSKKVAVTTENVCSNIGMIAIEDIKDGEVLVTIPRKCLLQSSNCIIKDIIANDELLSDVPGNSWVRILLAVMCEVLSPNSFWQPYVAVFPDYSILDSPFLWEKDFLDQELKGTGVAEAVERDQQRLLEDFNHFVQPFINKHQHLFNLQDHDFLTLYKKLVTFVMAYSFTEPSDEQSDAESDDEDDDKCPPLPMMVPVADILNHVANHNAKVGWGQHSLKIMACKPIQKGEEVFNTYGELANFELLHMYGFAEAHPDNFNDTVDISSHAVCQCLCDSALGEDYVKKRWQLLVKHGLKDIEALVWNVAGVASEDETLELLKVMCMKDDAELQAFGEDGETDISLNNEDLTIENLASLPDEWRNILNIVATYAESKYRQSFEEELKYNKDVEKERKDWRKIYASRVRLGQLSIIHNIKMASCSKTEKKEK